MSRNHKLIRQRRWARVRRAVFERDGWHCVVCGRAGRLECDHVIPLNRGGDPWNPDNLQTLCRPCHITKTAGENERVPSPAEAEWRALVSDMLSTT